MATITLEKSVSGTSFSIINPEGSPAEVYPVGAYSMSTNGNIVTLINIYTGLPIMSRLFSDVINGDDDEPFGDLAELQAYIVANCFAPALA